MITPKTTLKNPYYFFNEKVLYEIRDVNDNDECGVHKVFYVTEEKEVKKGEVYYDEHGNKVVAEEAGTVQASTNVIDDEASLAIFPGFYVQYNVVSEELYNQKKYYWLQDMIADGDTIDENGKFLINANHGAEEGQTEPVTYLSRFMDSVNKDLEYYIEQGYSIDEIKQRLPYYVFEHDENEEILINGKKATSVQVDSSFFTPIKEDDILESAYEVINKQAMDFADSKLKQYGKKVIRENVVWVDESKVEDVE